MATTTDAYKAAVRFTKWMRDCASEMDLNVDAVRGIWTLPDDDHDLTSELVALSDAAGAISRQLDDPARGAYDRRDDGSRDGWWLVHRYVREASMPVSALARS